MLEVSLDKIKNNARVLTSYSKERGITSVAGVFKFSDGNIPIARAMYEGGCAQLAASRVVHLKRAKEEIQGCVTLLLRLPALSEIPDVIRWCNLSLNSQEDTLHLLDQEARRQGKVHGVLLLLDVGDLREGVIDTGRLFELAIMVERSSHLHLAGVGSTFTCFGTILPTRDNLGVLLQSAAQIEKGIGRKLEIVSGGSSTSLTLMENDGIPEGVNHLRVGAFIVNPRSSRVNRGLIIPGMQEETMILRAEIIEVEVKPSKPFGIASTNWSGQKIQFVDRGTRRRAIVALGSQDIGDQRWLVPIEEGVQVLGGSSDHTILDIEDSPSNWKSGDILTFNFSYAPLLYAFSTRHVRIEMI